MTGRKPRLAGESLRKGGEGQLPHPPPPVPRVARANRAPNFRASVRIRHVDADKDSLTTPNATDDEGRRPWGRRADNGLDCRESPALARFSWKDIGEAMLSVISSDESHRILPSLHCCTR